MKAKVENTNLLQGGGNGKEEEEKESREEEKERHERENVQVVGKSFEVVM